MVRTDWDKIFSLNPSSLTDDEIEELCPTVIRCDVDEINDVHNLRVLMKLSQEMLQYKDNQVESLLLECGELKEIISSLKPEAAKRRKKERDVSDTKSESTSIPKFTEMQESANYEDALQGKDSKIKVLMAELEGMERENVVLKERFPVLMQEMEDATQKMNELSEELSSAQIKVVEYKDKISYLERENVALMNQVEEITAQQIDRDKVMDEFGAAIDTRINEWKNILDEKDAEIRRLKENLSQSVIQSVSSVNEQNKSQIIQLNEEIDCRDKIISELQAKLSEAVVEINESTTLIEKLKSDVQKTGKTSKRKEQRDLFKKLQDANEKISVLQKELLQTQEEAKIKDSKLCEVLSTLRKYEDGNQGLTNALNEVKKCKAELDDKTEHIKDLINVVNKLEMLNSYQEMEIISLRDKFGIPEDESISIQNALAKRKEESAKMEKLIQENKNLIDENLELKSDVRTLKYKLNKQLKDKDLSNNAVDGPTEFLHSTKLLEAEKSQYSQPDISEIKKDIQIVIEENEALRTGMHEILDSIRNQDGRSAVEIQSSTLERLLEALDVRHLAGWYHPAMRLQEHLNVVQGSNAELRGQLKQLRKELQKKDNILQTLVLNKNTDIEKIYAEESENEKIMSYVAEMRKLQEAYENEVDEWERQKESWLQRNTDLKNEVDNLNLKLKHYEENMKVFEEGEDEVRQAFAVKSKEYIGAASEILTLSRKNTALQQLLSKESTKVYQNQKEALKNESNLKKCLADADKRNKILECEITALQSNLLNSISIVAYNEIKEKYEEVNIRLRDILENNLIFKSDNEVQRLKDEFAKANEEKDKNTESPRKDSDIETSDNLVQQLEEVTAKECIERQRADNLSKLYEVTQAELLRCKDSVKEIIAAKSELQEELIAVHKKLSKELRSENSDSAEDNKIRELNDNIAALKTENESLTRLLQISQEEARLQYSLNSSKTLELDSLRHQILNLQAVSEDKATISRLDFELTSKKMSEMELSAQKERLENEVLRLQDGYENAVKTCDGLRSYVQDCRKQCENRCRVLLDIIGFFQSQYAGSTSISILNKVLSLSEKLKQQRQQIDVEVQKIKDDHENAKFQQEMLKNRLQIVESLKDILEQQIGSNSVQDIMQRFSEYSQQTLSDFKYKRKITQLEYELQVANNKSAEYETAITNIEYDMIQMQKAWSRGQEQQCKPDTQSFGTSPEHIQSRTASSQVDVERISMAVQTDPYTCCLDKKEFLEAEVQVNTTFADKDNEEKEQDESTKEVENKKVENDNSVLVLHEQLNQALKLSSERSAALMKYEVQLVEQQAKIDTLNRTIENKDLELAQKEKLLGDYKIQPHVSNIDGSDKLALKSTINSLQKLISQKEETIARYQNLLKEDRDEHSRAASRLQEEIKGLHNRILTMQTEAQQAQKTDNVVSTDLINSNKVEEPITKLRKTVIQEEEVARLNEKVSTLEADLNITKELSERWHRLAEERLKHMDRMRERLEEQHKNELESYRAELNKWQTEADTLRKQLSENRMLLTKGNISLMKELQERDDKIHELSLACQQLQNEVELMESANRTHQVVVRGESDAKIQETASFGRDPLQQQPQTDQIRKQLQSLMEKEKMYKHEIADLKQQLSRRYMIVKTQERKASQREIQLERKVKSLEEELEKVQTQLDREHLLQETKKAKTAEELLLWEKQKKWQQSAEKLKEKLKEKTDEYTKLLSNYEKLRSVVACMEREKWYLKSKLKFENNTAAGNLSARPIQSVQQNKVEELEKECQILRDRVKELTDRLENEDNEQLLMKINELKRHIAALEAVSNGNAYVINQLEKLETAKDILERTNLKLESENFELRLELEKAISDTPRLHEKVEHLQKYIELLKVEKLSDSTRSSEREVLEHGLKKSTFEMEKTIFALKGIIERLQTENKRLRISPKKNQVNVREANRGVTYTQPDSVLQKQYEDALRRIVALETDLKLAEQRVAMLEQAEKEDDNGDVRVLRQQLIHKSELLDKVKLLLTRAAMNEKGLRQRVQQLESKHTLSTIPECYVTPASPE